MTIVFNINTWLFRRNLYWLIILFCALRSFSTIIKRYLRKEEVSEMISPANWVLHDIAKFLMALNRTTNLCANDQSIIFNMCVALLAQVSISTI